MIAILYLLVMFIVGDTVGRRFFSYNSIQHRFAGAFIIGLLFATWFTYLAAVLFSGMSSPLLWANLSFFILSGGAWFLLTRVDQKPQPGDVFIRQLIHRISGKAYTADDRNLLESDIRRVKHEKWDWICLAVCLIFGTWLMFATLDFSEGSFKFAIKAWSDFGANLSLSQSMALGHNFPVEHPFFPGETVKYHFLFWFQAANLSFLGLNLAWSVNLLSVISLAALLILIMSLAESMFNSPVVGRIAAVLFFFGSTSLTYIPFLLSKDSIAAALSSIVHSSSFLNSGYPYRGETWGGLTINVYAYQRHLITGASMFLFVIVFLVDFYWRKITLPEILSGNRNSYPDPDAPADSYTDVGEADLSTENENEISSENAPPNAVMAEKQHDSNPKISSINFRLDIYAIILCGVVIGALPYWNSAVFVAAMIVIASLLIFLPQRRYVAILLATAVLVGLPQVFLLRSGNLAQTGESLFQWGYTVANPTVALVLEYIGWTFGVKLIIIIIALWFVSAFQRRLFIAFSSLVPAVFLFHFSTDAFNNHKLLNIWNILAALYVAYALWRIGRDSFPRILLACFLALAMIFSSIIDIFPIKNDAFVSVPYTDDRLTTWLLENTQPTDLFLSDTVLSHPIVFTGRKTFLGNTLFAWSAGYDMAERDKRYRALFRERGLGELIRLLNENKIAYVAIDDGLRNNNMHPSLNESVYRENFQKVFDDTDRRYGNLTIYKIPTVVPDGLPLISNADMTIPAITAFEGGPGSGRGQFAGPRGIAADVDGNFYVADTGNARIQKFSDDGNLVGILGKEGRGEGELYEPNGIAIDAKGNIYVTDAGNHRLLKLKSDGTLIKQWEGPEPKFFGPRDVAIGPNNLIYVVDQGRSRIVRINPETNAMNAWGGQGSGTGEFREPTGIEIGGDRVYVADAQNDRIQIFGLGGEFIAAWAIPEWNTYPWQYPDMAFDTQQKRLYVTSPLSKEIIVFDIGGNRLESLRPKDPGELENPSSLAIAKTKTDKWLYVTNTGSSKVYRFKLEMAAEKDKTSNTNSGSSGARR